MRPNDLATMVRWVRARRPDLTEPEWLRLAPGLERLVALASWRSQPIDVRAEALVDALDVARPVVRPAAGVVLPVVPARGEVARRGWTGDPIGPL